MVAFARACYRMAQEGQTGCKTAYDVAPGYLSPKSPEELRASML
jgi:diaminopimelate dehydrogenase